MNMGGDSEGEAALPKLKKMAPGFRRRESALGVETFLTLKRELGTELNSAEEIGVVEVLATEVLAAMKLFGVEVIMLVPRRFFNFAPLTSFSPQDAILFGNDTAVVVDVILDAVFSTPHLIDVGKVAVVTGAAAPTSKD